jgi:hypothetical protein
MMSRNDELATAHKNQPLFSREKATSTMTVPPTPQLPTGGYNAIFICGDRVYRIRFQTKADCEEYTAMLEKIRHGNADIVSDGGLEGMSHKKFKHRIKKWLILCGQFRSKWGDEMIPLDVKFAWNDGEKHAGFPLTKFDE